MFKSCEIKTVVTAVESCLQKILKNTSKLLVQYLLKILFNSIYLKLLN